MNPHPSYQQQQPHSQHSHQQQGSYQSYPQQQQQQSSHSSQHGYSQRPVQQQQQQHSTSSHQPQQQQQQLQQQQQQQRYAQQQQGQHAPNYQQSSSSQSQSRPQSLYPPSSSSSSSMSGPPSSTSASRAFAAARLEHFLEYCDKEIRNFFAGGCDSDSPDFDRFMSFKSGVRDCLSAFRSNPTNIEAISSNPQYKQLISDLSKRFGEAYKPHMLQPPPQLQAAAQAQMQQQKQQQQQMSRPQQPPQMQQHQPQSQQHSQYSQQQQHPQHTQQDVHPPQQYTQSHQPPPTQQRNYPQSSTQQSNSQLQQQQRQQQHPSSSQHMPQQQQQQQQQQPQQPPPPQQQQQQQPQQHPQSQMNANVAPSMQRVSSLDGSGRPVYNPNQSGAQAGARNLSALPPAQPPASLLSTSAAQAVTAMESRMNAGARGQSPQQPQQHLQQQQQQAPSSQQARQYPQQPPQQSQQQSQSQHAPQQAQHPPSQSTPGVNSGHAPDGPRVPPEIPEPIRPTPVTRLKRAAPDDLVRISTRVCRLMQMIDTPDTCALTVPALELPTYPPASSPLFILRNGAHPSHSEYLKHDVEIARAQGWTMVQQTNSFLLFRPSENRRYPLNLELNFTPTPTYPFEIPQWQFQSATVPPLLMQQVEQTVRTALGGQVMRLPQLLNKSFELARQIYDGIAKRAAASNAVGNNQIQP